MFLSTDEHGACDNVARTQNCHPSWQVTRGHVCHGSACIATLECQRINGHDFQLVVEATHKDDCPGPTCPCMETNLLKEVRRSGKSITVLGYNNWSLLDEYDEISVIQPNPNINHLFRGNTCFFCERVRTREKWVPCERECFITHPMDKLAVLIRCI